MKKKRTRKFNGKIYTYYDTRSRRNDANGIADWLRGRGNMVRIIGDYKVGYSIWVR